jgi:hypothetical protein
MVEMGVLLVVEEEVVVVEPVRELEDQEELVEMVKYGCIHGK